MSKVLKKEKKNDGPRTSCYLLNDHLAGSVVALDLLDHLAATHSKDRLRHFFKELRADVASDRDELERLMKDLNIDQSRTRKASTWLAEKFT